VAQGFRNPDTLRMRRECVWRETRGRETRGRER
jgi:hypothetical protein